MLRFKKNGYEQFLALTKLNLFRQPHYDILDHPVIIDMVLFFLHSHGSHIAVRLQELLYYQVDVDHKDICDYIEDAVLDGLVGK